MEMITFLPDEVLQLIFSYLKVPDKLNASLVCKKWLQLINVKSLMNDVEVFINSNSGVQVFTHMSRDFSNFTFNDMTIDETYICLFQRLIHHVKKISFIRCNKKIVCLPNISFETLKLLKIVECDLWSLFSSVPNLSELYLSENSAISDEGIVFLNNTMKNLACLHLPSNITFDQKVYKRFYPENTTFKTNPSDLILSFPAVLNFISERASTLTEIAISSRLLSGSALKQLAHVQNLQLTNIDLHPCFECTKGLVDFFQNQLHLKAINLNNLGILNDNIIKAMCDLPNIEQVKMQSCTLTDISLYHIFQLKKLKVLDIGKCHGWSQLGFHTAVSSIKCKDLKELDIHCIKVPEAIFVLIKQCKYLTTLNLANTLINDEHVHAISEYLVHMKSLSLCYNNISDHGLNGYEFYEQNSENIFLHKNKPISNLKCLRELQLQACDKITDQGVIKSIKFPFLKSLNLNNCINISERTIETLFSQNPNLIQIFWNSLLLSPFIPSFHKSFSELHH